jgi:ABC-type nitrate/sulfonate/bicarbonate transport system substrate-binding protein
MKQKTHFINRRNFLATTAGLAGGMLVSRVGWAQSGFSGHIRIATASSNLATTLQTLLQDGDFLKRFGLTSELTFVQDGNRLMGAVLSGDIDLCPLSGFSQLFPAVSKGAKVKLVNGSVRYGQQAIFSGDPDVKTIADLRGKTIGIGAIGAQLHQITLALLLKNNVDPNDVTFASVGSSADVFRAIVAGIVDAGSSQIDNIPLAEASGVHVVDGGRMWQDLKEFPFQGGYASDEAIASKRDILVHTLAAYAALFRYVSGPDSLEAFKEARRKALSKSDADFDAASEFQWNFMQENQPFANDLQITPEAADYVQDLNIRVGVQKEKLPFDSAIDMSLASEAIALL